MKEYTFGRVVRTGLWGAFLGGVAGFALGLLVAPEEGRTTRRRVIYQLERLAERVGVLAERLLSPEAGSEARRTGDALVEDARAQAQRIRAEIDALIGELQQHGPSD